MKDVTKEQFFACITALSAQGIDIHPSIVNGWCPVRGFITSWKTKDGTVVGQTESDGAGRNRYQLPCCEGGRL